MITRSIFRAYDIRGLHPQDVNEDAIILIAKALAEMFPAGVVIVAHDGRHGSSKLAKTIADEIVRCGSSFKKEFCITFVGLATTPMYYFLVNHFDAVGGAMITASHNPKEYNGIKSVHKKAVPVNSAELLALIDKQNGI